MKIFPFNQNKPAWQNWLNYLNWIGAEVNSLNNYLGYFNPDFKIKNQELSTIQSKTWKPSTQAAAEKDYSFDVRWYNDDFYYFAWVDDLGFREGIFAPSLNTYGALGARDEFYLIKNEGGYLYKNIDGVLYGILDKDAFDKALNGNFSEEEPDKRTIKLIPLGHTIWGRKNPSVKNVFTDDWSRFITLAQPYAGLYLPQGVDGGVGFRFVKNGQKALGSNLLFSIETTPGRYFLTNNENKYWTESQWSITGALWESSLGEATVLVSNINGQVWTNSYPIMHNLYLTTTKNDGIIYEEFFTDDTFQSGSINIAGHFAAEYKITTLDNLKALEENIYVSII